MSVYFESNVIFFSCIAFMYKYYLFIEIIEKEKKIGVYEKKFCNKFKYSTHDFYGL